MDAKDFVDYLKGGIELGQLSQIDTVAFNKMKETLSKVKQDSSSASGFCQWLEGMLDCADEAKIEGKNFNLLIQKLNEVKHKNAMTDYIEKDTEIVTSNINTNRGVFTIGGNGRKC